MQKKIEEYNTGRVSNVSIMEDKTNTVPSLHFHSSYEIYITHSGPVSCVVNDKIYDLMPNDMMVFAPTDIHMIIKPENLKYISTVFVFYPDKVCKLSEKIDLLLPFNASAESFSNKRTLSRNQAGIYIGMLKRMEVLIKSKNGADDLKQQLLMAEILLFVYDLYSENFRQKGQKGNYDTEPVFSILKYITENIDGDLSLDNISEKFFLSKNIINKHFKQKTGYTLGKYITNYRMYCARQMLEQGEGVYNTAWKVGYQNVSNFIRTFKKINGITPGVYKIMKNQ